MLPLLRAILLTGGFFFLTIQAKAEDAPADTAAFVAYCDNNLEACRQNILMINNMNRTIKMGIVEGKHVCTFPETPAKPGVPRTRADSIADSTAATNAILGWLKANVAKRKSKTEDAVAQAEKTLWPGECN
jgi:hypothetical protein